ncbi:ABC transporter ATP-binding protein [Lipingzhangella sp. LS1_29]|uniref:ABC transporter ATP-binding protein n=1 Tax=Lipingzhangella rawalii TaxID=2055835 RepID=A0ABU2H6A1_9ACTN|nr:ABC transporter ATP-binding protein [Lipingzhangella rawalii]MDS1270833.1 ABC transporter ATP-binding protein [Lipingzhangella rawalii]
MTEPTVAAGAAPGEGQGPSPGALRLNNVEVIYDEVILVLRGLSLEVAPGSVVALLGSNGAGKSTTLKAVSGLLPTEHGEVTDGQVLLDEQDVTHVDAARRVRRGMSLCMEGRHVFEHLTVQENLVAGAYSRGRARPADLDLVYGYFPRLSELRSRVSGFLSGGEQQMLAIGRALMSHPRLLMLDEPSLGLAPRLVEEIFGHIRRLNQELGTTILVVEQNARQALDIADYGYVMERGRVVLDGPATELRENPDVKEFYLGVGKEGERRSYRDVKHYKRRKRWL